MPAEPNVAKDFEFLLAVVKSSGGFTVDYEDVAAKLGVTKQSAANKMSQFRKQHDWPINKAASKAAVKGPKVKTPKRAADDGEAKKPAAKRAKKTVKDKEVDQHEETPAADEETPASDEEPKYFEEELPRYFEGAEGEYIY
ncbi:hypothetical protein BDZ45DRAFT_790184 [Acephala macrosclerotiorum]|nr:hypothetical protein BDZ45DRAFT_790184 [Acephala macrosclerotiorum]